MSKSNFILSYLLEKWLIEDRRRIFLEYEESSEEQLLQKVKKTALQSLFLLKRQLDPGFRIKIFEKIKQKLDNDKEFFKLIRKKLLSFTNIIQFFAEFKLVDSNREWMR